MSRKSFIIRWRQCHFLCIYLWLQVVIAINIHCHCLICGHWWIFAFWYPNNLRGAFQSLWTLVNSCLQGNGKEQWYHTSTGNLYIGYGGLRVSQGNKLDRGFWHIGAWERVSEKKRDNSRLLHGSVRRKSHECEDLHYFRGHPSN